MSTITSTALPAQSQMALLQAQQSTALGKNAAINAHQMAKMEETSQDFEAMFVTEMMRPMFDGLETDGMFGGGKGEEVFRGMLLGEYGKLIARTGSIGLSASIKDAMIQMQEQASQQ